MSYTIESIAECIGARRVGECEATIDWLLTDSRSLSFPEETLFFALTTKRNSGARYIPDLYARGVRNFVRPEWLSCNFWQDGKPAFSEISMKNYR